MMEKDQPDSMATVQMTKADYAASDVYSTTSEPPPVSESLYKRSHNYYYSASIFILFALIRCISMKEKNNRLIHSKRINTFR